MFYRGQTRQSSGGRNSWLDVVSHLGDASVSHHFLSQIIAILIQLFFMAAEQTCIINYSVI